MKKLICGLTLIFCLVSLFGCSPKPDPKAVSYTHLDVYKRQVPAGVGEDAL